MARYIDIEPLEKEGWYMARVYNDSFTSQTYETKKLKEFPAADVVERKRGEWVVIHNEIFADRYKCSCCGEYAQENGLGEEILSNYCPNCGARMLRGEQE